MKKLLLMAGVALCAAGAFAQNDAEITVLAEADFTTLTQGSPEEPVAFPSYGTGSFSNLYPSWYSGSVKQAGGQLLIGDGGYVRTPSKDMSAHSGVVRVRARVRMMDDYGGILRLSIGYSSSQSLTFTDTDWHDVSVVMSGGSYSSYVRMEPSLSASGVLVQNMIVEQSDAFFVAPEAIQPNQADGISFTAKWSSVKGATGYFLDVYSYNADGTKDYFVNNEAIAGTVTSKQVTGLDASKKYYYVVRATNGTGVSADSNEIEVIKVIYYLGKPTDVNVITTADSFTATWTGDPDARSYILNLDGTRVLKADETVALLSEDFSNITDGTLESINFIINSNLDPYTKAPGWEGAELGKAAGHMVLTPFSGNAGYLNTPVLDLSRSEGRFTVDLRAAIGAFGRYYTGTADVRLLNAAGDVVETHTIDLSGDFADYTAEFTGGLTECRVSVLYNGDYKLFIDDMAVKQTLVAGQSVTSRILEATTEETTFSHTFTGEGFADMTYTLTVTAAAETVMGTDIVPIYSDASDAVSFTVGANVGIDGIEAGDILARRYYNAAGIASPTPHEGLNIVETVYTDGRRTVTKALIRK